jgi:hypothetical protein
MLLLAGVKAAEEVVEAEAELLPLALRVLELPVELECSSPS